MVENTNASGESATTPNETELVSEILGVDASEIQSAKEESEASNQPEKAEVADDKPQEKAEAEKPEQGDKPAEGEAKEGEEKSEPTEAAATGDARITRLDKRIAKLAVTNAAIAGREIDLEDALAIVKAKSFEEKKQILQDLLSENARFRGSESREITEEDLAALAESRAEEILAQREIAEAEQAEMERQNGWHGTVADLIKENHTLDEKHKDYNPKLAKALELMLSDDGKTPRYGIDPRVAWEKVLTAAGLAEEKAQAEADKNKGRSLSGAISGTGSKPPKVDGYTWEEIAEIERTDPARFERIVREGKLPQPEM